MLQIVSGLCSPRELTCGQTSLPNFLLSDGQESVSSGSITSLQKSPSSPLLPICSFSGCYILVRIISPQPSILPLHTSTGSAALPSPFSSLLLKDDRSRGLASCSLRATASVRSWWCCICFPCSFSSPVGYRCSLPSTLCLGTARSDTWVSVAG